VRVLLDEQLPRHLAWQLVGQDVRTVHDQGWAGVTDRELLARADAAGFEALLTMDHGFEQQHDPAAFRVRIILVHDLSTELGDLLVLVPELLAAIARAAPGEVVRVPLRERGVVSSFSSAEGHGRITCDRTGDLLFVQLSQIRAARVRTLAAGERVEFTRVEMPEGPYASDVLKVDSSG
jgi:cold shock CspA family protein/predicted nuclease of predicted toxin-antitoxin system